MVIRGMSRDVRGSPVVESVVYPVGVVQRGYCHWCGSAISGCRPNRKWCSSVCSRRAYEFRRRGDAPAGNVRANEGVSSCRGCGDPLVQSGRGRPKRWCSGACRVRAFREGRSGSEASAAAVQAKADAKAEVLAATADVVCEVCGGEVRRSAAGHPRKYCSRSCSNKAVRVRAVKEGRICSVDGCGRAASSKGLCGSHYAIEWGRLNPDKRSAKAHRYRARKLAAFVEDVGRIGVMERDGWVCHICGESIGKELEFPHRLYGTLDHVVPLSKGGLHCLDNVKAAHWICNSLKRNDEAFVADDALLGMVLGDVS